MTPPATTPAGRRSTKRTTGGARSDASTRIARRVSGPAGGRAAGARQSSPRAGAATRASTHRQTATRPARTAIPRRSSGATTSRRSRQGPLGARVVAAVRGLPDHPLLDRVIRGRVWIPLLGVMLAGIVAMQVEVLKLGASIGRSLQSETVLQSHNELLRASVAALADDQRIERIAAAHGMVIPAPDGVGFLTARRVDGARAAAVIHAPNAASFLSLLTSNGNVASVATPPSPSDAGTAASSSATQATSSIGATATSTPSPTAGSPASGTTAATAAAAASTGVAATSGG
jgi:hypothetical protein